MSNWQYLRYKDSQFTGAVLRDAVCPDLLNLIRRIPEIDRPKEALRVDQTGTRYTYHVSFTCGGHSIPCFLKRIDPKSTVHLLLSDSLLSPLATYSWRNSCYLASVGILTPDVIAILEVRRYGLPIRSYSITREITDFVFIDAYIHGGFEGKEAHRNCKARSERIQVFASFVRTLHEKRVCHFDLSKYNIMVKRGAGGADIYIIDLDSMIVTRKNHGLVWRFFCWTDLIIMNAMFKKDAFSKTDRARFVAFYTGKSLRELGARGRFLLWLFERQEIGDSRCFKGLANLIRKFAYLVGIVRRLPGFSSLPKKPVITAESV